MTEFLLKLLSIFWLWFTHCISLNDFKISGTILLYYIREKCMGGCKSLTNTDYLPQIGRLQLVMFIIWQSNGGEERTGRWTGGLTGVFVCQSKVRYDSSKLNLLKSRGQNRNLRNSWIKIIIDKHTLFLSCYFTEIWFIKRYLYGRKLLIWKVLRPLCDMFCFVCRANGKYDNMIKG